LPYEISDPDWIQTNDPKLRRFVLYSAELPDLHVSVKCKKKNWLTYQCVRGFPSPD
jgi:hypothetical protein